VGCVVASAIREANLTTLGYWHSDALDPVAGRLDWGKLFRPCVAASQNGGRREVVATAKKTGFVSATLSQSGAAGSWRPVNPARGRCSGRVLCLKLGFSSWARPVCGQPLVLVWTLRSATGSPSRRAASKLRKFQGYHLLGCSQFSGVGGGRASH